MASKPFLILQLRPEAEASDNEYEAMLEKSGLDASEVIRLRLEQEALPEDFDLDDYSGVIVGGGPGCVSDALNDKSEIEKRIENTVLSLMPEITKRDFPFLGCCYGIGILAHHLGATVSKERYGEPVSVTTAAIHPEPLAILCWRVFLIHSTPLLATRKPFRTCRKVAPILYRLMPVHSR